MMSKKIKENFLNVSCVVESVVSLLFLMCENMPCACVCVCVCEHCPGAKGRDILKSIEKMEAKPRGAVNSYWCTGATPEDVSGNAGPPFSLRPEELCQSPRPAILPQT